jgi:hypothetical protein
VTGLPSDIDKAAPFVDQQRDEAVAKVDARRIDPAEPALRRRRRRHLREVLIPLKTQYVQKFVRICYSSRHGSFSAKRCA